MIPEFMQPLYLQQPRRRDLRQRDPFAEYDREDRWAFELRWVQHDDADCVLFMGGPNHERVMWVRPDCWHVDVALRHDRSYTPDDDVRSAFDPPLPTVTYHCEEFLFEFGPRSGRWKVFVCEGVTLGQVDEYVKDLGMRYEWHWNRIWQLLDNDSYEAWRDSRKQQAEANRG